VSSDPAKPALPRRKVFEAESSTLSGPFWEATRHRQLVLPWCTACERAIWFPREICPHCRGTTFEWRPARGEGEVRAVSVHQQPGLEWGAIDGPHAVALVELPEGVRMMSPIVGCALEDITVGMAVRVSWLPLSDGRHLPQFAPAEATPRPAP
jgi:uncharacterized OB-fold protein